MDLMNNLPLNYFGEGRIKTDVPMENKTYFKIGGKADYYFEPENLSELKSAIRLCNEIKLPYFLLGLGANILVGDKGIRGMVIRVVNNSLEVVGEYSDKEGEKQIKTAHYQPVDKERYLRFEDLDDPEFTPDTLIRVGAGVSLSHLISWSLEHGLTGLQYFSGIPSTVGGCVYNNVHGGTKLFSQYVESVVLVNQFGEAERVDANLMEFSYDYSRIQNTKEIVFEVYLKLQHGDINRARFVRDEWFRRKLRVQPQTYCSGCIFKNLSEEDAKRVGSPTVSAGWLIDIGLGLKNKKIGGVEISPKHANFFVNTGNGTAKDVLQLIEYVKGAAKDKYNVTLVEEIQLVGEM